MRPTRAGIAALAFAAALASAQQPASYGIRVAPAPAGMSVSGAQRDYGRLPLGFERVGAADGSERWIGRRSRRGIAVDATGFVLASVAPGDASATYRAFAFVGADTRARVEGLDPQPRALYRIGGDASAVSSAEERAFGQVRVAQAYPGIDVIFYDEEGDLEYDVVVAPGADPSAFSLRTPHARVRVDDAGDLVVSDAHGSSRLRRPTAYQIADGRRITVDSAFAVAPNGDVGFHVGAYDNTRALVIDPVVSYATYVGGSAFEQGTSIAVDAAGSAYIAGYTLSSNFPTVSAFDGSLGRKGDVDVFVAKLNAAGTALVWSTYLGGANAVDRAVGIAVDAAGSAYVTGYTTGSDFPVTATAWQKGTAAGGTFVTKLAPGGNALMYSTYVAGARSNAIAVDRNGNAYVTGSAAPAFATTPAALQRQPGNATATGFVLKLDASGSLPAYATFIGGSAADEATSIAVDAAGSAYVGGWTSSSDFPVAGAIQSAPRGNKDAFLAKLDPSGSRLIYATRLGGALDDSINAVAIDATGNAYVAGETYSADFPVAGAFQSVKAGARLINSSTGSAFVAKIGAAGNALVYSSFLGGEVCRTTCQVALGSPPQFSADAAYGIAVDAAGHAYVSGLAGSYTFPLVDSTSARKQQDNQDSAFVAKVSASGSTLLWSTFVRTGFSEFDNHWTRFPTGASTGIAVDAAGAAYVTGDADGTSNFAPSNGAYQSTTADRQGATVVKFAAVPFMTLATSSARVDAQAPITLTVSIAGAPASGDVEFLDGAATIGGATLAANRASLVTTLPVGIHTLGAVLRTAAGVVDAPDIHQVVEPPLTCN